MIQFSFATVDMLRSAVAFNMDFSGYSVFWALFRYFVVIIDIVSLFLCAYRSARLWHLGEGGYTGKCWGVPITFFTMFSMGHLRKLIPPG